MALAEAFVACLPVIRTLEALGVDYLVGGSLASSFHGTPRSTQDVDLVADMKAVHATLLAGRLQDAYYVDREQILASVRRRSSFNLIDLKTMFKIDVFVMKDEPFAREAMRRRQRVDIGEGEEVDIASAEDTVLQKIAWFRQGGERSERQWLDILGVIKVSKTELDFAYLDRWAEHLTIAHLLDRILIEAGIRSA